MTQRIYSGARVKTLELGDPSEINAIAPERLRESGITGVAEAWVAGNHANAWWVRHDNDPKVVSPYWAHELELLTMPDVGASNEAD